VAIFDIANLRHTKVGSTVETLKSLKQHYALVTQLDEPTQEQFVHSLSSPSRLSQQLRMGITRALFEAQSIVELHKDLGE